MTKDEFESETGRFVATLTTLDTTLHTEFKPDGTLVIQGFCYIFERRQDADDGTPIYYLVDAEEDRGMGEKS